MTIPRVITIGGKRIRIRRIRKLESWGEYHHDKATIFIRAGIAQDDQIATLRHEMMHASLAIGGVSFARKLDEESVVRCLADEIFWPAWEKLTQKLHD